MTTVGIALAVALFTMMAAFANGVSGAFTKAGSERRIVVTARGVFAESMSRIPRDTLARLRSVSGIALASPEAVVLWVTDKPGGGDVTVTMRGVSEAALHARPEVKITSGRAPRFGTDEVMVGVGAVGRVDGLVLGGSFRPARRQYPVVGVFTAEGSALESEVWGDLDAVLSEDHRSELSSVLLPLAEGVRAEDVISGIDHDRNFALHAQTEAAYYALQATNADFLRLATALVSIIMGAGAVFGALNTMYTRLSDRQREIAVLRAVGFARRRIVVALMFESIVVALCAGVLGCLGALPIALQRVDAFNIYALSHVSVQASVTPGVVASGMAFALLIGVLGGFWPALQVTGAPLPVTLRGRW
jgi:putative ABC transport system permease protein